jgi:hypothetical protein
MILVQKDLAMINRCRNCAVYCTLLTCIVGATQAQVGPNLLANPSFEQPALTPGTASDVTPTAWGLLNGIPALITQGYTGGGVLWPHPTDGSQFLYIGDNATATSLFQDVTLAAATHYRLTFDEANFLSMSDPSGARLSVDVLTNGQSILGGPVTFTRPEGADFATQELDFTTGNAGAYRLLLSQPGGYGTNVDNFNLSVASTTSVPEANSLAMALLGGGLSIGSVYSAQRHQR